VISVLITAPDDPQTLTRVLTALVPAAAEGLVREVAVIGAAGPGYAIADDAGAGLYDDFAEAYRRAKGPWIAALPPGPNLAPDWMALVIAHLAKDEQQPARLVARSSTLSLKARPEGWLVPKSLAGSAGVVEQDLQRLARRGGGRLRILDRR
jgi:hypothetical protein